MNRIMSGRQTSSSRAEIEARYREDTAADMDAARDAAAEQGEDFARNTITEIAAVVRNFEVPSLDLAARAGLCAAADPHHRDAMIGIVRISPQAAADAFGTIAAHLRGNYRVQVLTLAGLAAYVDGDGAAAGIALEAASAIGVDPTLRRCSRCSTRPARPESSPRRSPTLPPSASRWRARWESNSTPNSRTDKTAAPTQLERVGAAPYVVVVARASSPYNHCATLRAPATRTRLASFSGRDRPNLPQPEKRCRYAESAQPGLRSNLRRPQRDPRR